MSTYVVWSCDWESRTNFTPLHLFNGVDLFEKVSCSIIDLARDIIGGKMVWYAKVDFYADITYYNQFEELVANILDDGGQLGIHIHHVSCEPARRKTIIQRAADRVAEVGFPVTTYSAGMGNRISTDTEALLQAGIQTERGAFPFLRYGDPAKHPDHCDWVGADLFPGYVDPNDYKRIRSEGGLFTYALGGNPHNTEGHSQLHIAPHISLGTLQRVFDWHFEHIDGHFPCVGVYFHPYDLTAKGRDVNPDMVGLWRTFAGWLQQRRDVTFIVDSQARELYEQWKASHEARR